ncbi:MAG: tail fiber protein [Verrucomicrobiota bacterium]|jgi:microcystin-dependent protein
MLRLVPIASLLFAVHVVMGQSRPEPPDVLFFEGSMVGADGVAIGSGGAANYPVVFRVFDNLVGGRLLWSEQQTVAVFQGSFSALLGEGNANANEPRPPLSSIFQSSTASDRFVEVTLRGAGSGGTDVTVSPRTRLVAGAYSMLATHARTAETLVNQDGQSVLTPTGSKVGILRANPTATLDVAGSIASTGVILSGGASTAGSVDADGFYGLGMAPVGSIVMWTGSTPPRGWVLCTGAVVSGVTTPDLRGRFILGSGDGPGLTSRPIHHTGGEEAHALTAAEIPSHSHSASFSGRVSDGTISPGSGSSLLGSHTYRMAMGSAAAYLSFSDDSSRANGLIGSAATSYAGAHNHGLDIPGFQSSESGEGRPHNNMPPFYVLAFIMRVQ